MAIRELNIAENIVEGEKRELADIQYLQNKLLLFPS